MLDILHEVEAALPKMLKKDQEHEWKSVRVDYQKPYVDRLWRPWNDCRIYLHCIYPCESSEALMHPHAWPSAMRVVQGKYEMGVGYGVGDDVPPIAARMILNRYSEYEMVEPNAWHYVRPHYSPSFSLMVSGPPNGRKAPKSEAPLGELSWREISSIFSTFRLNYRP